MEIVDGGGDFGWWWTLWIMVVHTQFISPLTAHCALRFANIRQFNCCSVESSGCIKCVTDVNGTHVLGFC